MENNERTILNLIQLVLVCCLASLVRWQWNYACEDFFLILVSEKNKKELGKGKQGINQFEFDWLLSIPCFKSIVKKMGKNKKTDWKQVHIFVIIVENISTENE